MHISGKEIRLEGNLIRIARVAEGYEFVDPEAMVRNFRESDIRVDLFTFIQSISQLSPKYRYPMEWENLAAMSISTFDDWFTRQIKGKTRNMIRKAEKSGVTVREVPFDDELIRGIAAINDESPIRQGMRYWHYKDDLETVRRKNGSFLSRSVFFGVFFEESLIGYAKLVTDEAQGQAGLMQILSMMRHRDKAPNNMLIAQAVRSCAERKIPYLWYANFFYGNKPQDSLGDFKENNGFQRVEIPRYYIPLTPIGRLALYWGLHHRMQDHLPEFVVARLRRFRQLWLNRKYQITTQTS